MAAELDFSALNKIAQVGGASIPTGFITVNDSENPFKNASETALKPPLASDPISSKGETVKRKNEAFLSATGQRNYNTLYRAAHDYHENHKQIPIDREYWRTHTAGEDVAPQAEMDYWVKAGDDLRAVVSAHNGDLFLTDLLLSVYDELEREYNALRATA